MDSSVHTWCLNPEPVDQKIDQKTMNQNYELTCNKTYID